MNILPFALSVALAAVADYQPFAEIRPPAFSQPITGVLVSTYTIERELAPFINNKCKLTVMDGNFGCIPEKTIRDLIAVALFDFDNTYIVEARDCDDLALEFIVKLRKSFRDFTDGVPLAAPIGLVGIKLVQDIPEMGYFLHGKIAYHAVVVVRCEEGKWLLVDPGTKKISEFTGHLYEGSAELLLGIF
jgi:hypothetical protein